MTMKEFAKQLADEIRKKPTHAQVAETVNRILKVTVDGKPISDSQIQQIISYLDDELGNFAPVCEQFDNHETLTFMEEINRLIAQAKKEG